MDPGCLNEILFIVFAVSFTCLRSYIRSALSLSHGAVSKFWTPRSTDVNGELSGPSYS